MSTNPVNWLFFFKIVNYVHKMNPNCDLCKEADEAFVPKKALRTCFMFVDYDESS
jgi:hypothetical protein